MMYDLQLARGLINHEDEDHEDEAMMRKTQGVRAVALTMIVVSSLLAGCHNGPPPDAAKEPNKDVKAGPPNASPEELKQIQEHMRTGH